MRGFADKSFDLVLTSPPYDNLRDYNGYSFDFEWTAREIQRVLKDGGVCVWVVGDATIKGSETGTSFKQALYLKEIGMNLHDTMIWEKHSFSNPCPNRYHSVFEYMFVFSKGKPKTFNPLKDRKNIKAGVETSSTVRERDGSITKRSRKTIAEYGTRFNVWKMNNVSSQKGTRNKDHAHPAAFPLSLAKDHILSWSNEGDTVLDPFLGSGTTTLACQQLNRNAIGIEISEEYCEIARKRFEKGTIVYQQPTPMKSTPDEGE